jgi:hypothetical protein
MTMRRSRVSSFLAGALGVGLALSLLPAQARSQVWYREWFLDQRSSQGKDVAVDQAGNVVVLGMTFGGRGLENTDVLLRKYDVAGNQLWSSLIDYSFVETSGGVAVDSEGSVLVSGSRQASSQLMGFLQKYDASGNLLWDREFGSSAHNDARSVAVGPGDVVYWIGTAVGQGAVWKFDSSGNELWTTQFAGPAGFSVSPSAGAVDAAGNLYVAGNYRGVSGGSEGFLVKFTPDGIFRWTRQLSEGSASVADAAVDTGGNIRVAGRRSHPLGVFERIPALDIGFVRTYGPNGDVVSDAKVHGVVPPRSMALDGAGSTYLVGGDGQIVLMKLDPAGKIEWEEVIDLDGPEPFALAVEPAGGILVTGGTDRAAFVMKVDQSPSCLGSSNPEASEDGALSRPIHLRVEHALGVAPKVEKAVGVGPTIHKVNCSVVVRVGL